MTCHCMRYTIAHETVMPDSAGSHNSNYTTAGMLLVKAFHHGTCPAVYAGKLAGLSLKCVSAAVECLLLLVSLVSLIMHGRDDAAINNAAAADKENSNAPTSNPTTPASAVGCHSTHPEPLHHADCPSMDCLRQPVLACRPARLPPILLCCSPASCCPALLHPTYACCLPQCAFQEHVPRERGRRDGS